MVEEQVVLVDESGAPLGTGGKLEVHEPPGTLHLAFSVLLYRRDGETLLQRRAATKYHFPLAWTNACCSHPRPGEAVDAAAVRRVREELGLACAPRHAGAFTYRATCPRSDLVEYEFDHVLIAEIEEEPRPDPAEVADVAWIAPAALLSGASGLELTPWCLTALRIAEAARAPR